VVTHDRTTGLDNHAGVPGPNGHDPVHARCHKVCAGCRGDFTFAPFRDAVVINRLPNGSEVLGWRVGAARCLRGRSCFDSKTVANVGHRAIVGV